MEAPPQFSGAPKKSKTGLIIGGVALAIVLCCCGVCGLGGYFGKDFLKNAFGFSACGLAINSDRNALIEYANAHGGKLPSAGTWQDDIKPYVRKASLGRRGQEMIPVPGPDDGFCDQGAKTGITFNVELAGKKIAEVKDPYGTVALFETPGTGRNKSGKWSEPPFATSPKVIAQEGRGWIRQPLQGDASIKDRNGSSTAVPKVGSRTGGASIQIETKPDKGGGPSSED